MFYENFETTWTSPSGDLGKQAQRAEDEKFRKWCAGTMWKCLIVMAALALSMFVL